MLWQVGRWAGGPSAKRGKVQLGAHTSGLGSSWGFRNRGSWGRQTWRRVWQRRGQGPAWVFRAGAPRHDCGARCGDLVGWASRSWVSDRPFQDDVAAMCCSLLEYLSVTLIVLGWTNPRTSVRKNFLGTSPGSGVLRDGKDSWVLLMPLLDPCLLTSRDKVLTPF